MSYTKTNWVNGSTPVNANNMNHIEDGIFNAYGLGGSITLSTTGWISDSSLGTNAGYQTVTLSNLKDSDAIFFSPLNFVDKSLLEAANIVVSSSGSTVTFKAQTIPQSTIQLNYFIARGN